MTNPLLLDKNLHIRLPEALALYLSTVARSHFLKPSTFARILLNRHLPDYTKNRDFI